MTVSHTATGAGSHATHNSSLRDRFRELFNGTRHSPKAGESLKISSFKRAYYAMRYADRSYPEWFVGNAILGRKYASLEVAIKKYKFDNCYFYTHPINDVITTYFNEEISLSVALRYVDFLRNYFPLNSEIGYAKKETPLIAAMYSDSSVLVSKLLERGANPNYKDSDGDTALHYLAKNLTPENKKNILKNTAFLLAYNKPKESYV